MKRTDRCAILLGILCAGVATPVVGDAVPAQPAGAVQAEYRGCETAGWCVFRTDLLPGRLLHVRPAGVAPMLGDDPVSLAVRNRLNALLAGMIHQHKRIVLNDLRKLEDGTFEAEVTVNETHLAADPILLELSGKRGRVDR